MTAKPTQSRINRGGALAWILLFTFAWTGCATNRSGFDPKHDGRLTRMALSFPLVPVVWTWMGYHILTEDRGPRPFQFERAIRYEVTDFAEESNFDGLDSSTKALLLRHAPILIQETRADADYAPFVDRIGKPEAESSGDGEKVVRIDTRRPTIYAFTSHASINGRPRLQLNYVYWFPLHPKMKALFDPEAGNIEGLTLRVTLGPGDEPMLFETVYNCGCYHRVYPAEWVETEARGEFGPPQPARHSAVHRKIPRKIDLYTPGVVRDASGERIVIFSESGRHMPLGIGREGDIAARARIMERLEAELRPYEELETGGGDGLGIFNADSLVAGADRPESWMLFPSGLYHAGTPRRRGNQLIHFDQYDFDDPRLLEKYLKLPSGG